MEFDVAYICPVEYFKSNGGLCDEIGEYNCEFAFSSLESCGIYLYELMEGIFEISSDFPMSQEKIKKCFIDNGFVTDPKFDEMFK
jgi:hypothetical protein